jgi:BirA family biotin operon repressor/biotin-[acetyl-CoA-carboxylase] ligase
MTFEGLHLKARWLGTQRIDLEACGSTNDVAARMARAGARHGTIIVAERQTSGRGRDGRVWQSPPGGLYLSAILRPALPIVDVPPMTLAIGIGVCDAVRAFLPASDAGTNGSTTSGGASCVLKWPNDLLVRGRKLAGVLVETQSQGNRLESVVVGIGINLDGKLPEVVAGSGISLAEASGAPVDREAFITRLLADLERWIDRYVGVGLEAIIPAWQERMAAGLSARATVDGASMTGHMAGLDLDGSLLLRDHAGTVHRVRSGDVEVLRPAC